MPSLPALFQCSVKGVAKASEVHLSRPVGFAWAEVSGETTAGGPHPSLGQGSPTLRFPSLAACTLIGLLTV